ncbi:MAG: AI-2E family transporter, partial [Lachnospiraceae bacterium]
IIYMLINNWSDTKKFIYNLFGVLSPFFAAVLIAYFVSPIVVKYEGLILKYITKGGHKKLAKVLAMVFAYITLIGFIIIAFVFVIPQTGESISELASNVPVVYSHVLSLLKELHQKYPAIDVNVITDRLNEMVPNIVDFGTNVVGNVVPMIFSVSVSIVRGLVNMLLALFISIYMINGKDLFRYQAKRFVYALFEEKKGDVICNTFRECNDIFSAFLISKAVDSLIIGCICCILMNILRLPYSVLISVIVGITNMIPYFGPFIGAVPGVLIYLCTSPKQAVIFVIMILVLQQFDGLVLGPRLLGQSTGLNPMWVIFAITVGGAYFGVLGMFIGVPVVAVAGFLANKFIKYKLQGRDIKALKEWEQAE